MDDLFSRKIKLKAHDNKIVIFIIFSIFHLLALSSKSNAFDVVNLKGFSNLCGAYASVTKVGKKYEVWTNAIPGRDLFGDNGCDAKSNWRGCPGIVKYESVTDITDAGYGGVKVPNSIINDVFDSTGNLHPNRVFSRPTIILDPKRGYVGVAYVAPGYPSENGQMTPSWITSPDGINWTYHGKFKGEPARESVFGSGMALKINKTGPRYTLYTDGFSNYPGTVALKSNGDNQWKFARNSDFSVHDFRPQEWKDKNLIFHSISTNSEGELYMAATENWPPSAWLWMKSIDDGETFSPVRRDPFTDWGKNFSAKKNVSLFSDQGRLRVMETLFYGWGCYSKSVGDVITP